jgi:hypothetical protein
MRSIWITRQGGGPQRRVATLGSGGSRDLLGAGDPRTKKVLGRVGEVSATDADRSTTRLGDWYVNVVFWKPQVALFVTDVTLQGVLVPFAPAATVLDRFPPAASLVINEFKHLADSYAKVDGETDLLALAMRLAETPWGPRYTRHVSADRELAALVASTAPNSFGRA